jgi:hypothetical protein
MEGIDNTFSLSRWIGFTGMSQLFVSVDFCSKATKTWRRGLLRMNSGGDLSGVPSTWENPSPNQRDFDLP